MKIIGLTSDTIRHDASICLVEDGKVAFASSEDRFSKLKHDPRPPMRSLEYILEKKNLTIREIDAIAVGMPPFHLFKGLGNKKELFSIFTGLKDAFLRHPSQLYRYIKGRRRGPGRMGFEWLPKEKIHFISHYQAHGSSAYRTSGFDSALSINMDAAGSDEGGRPLSGAVYLCREGAMNLFEEVPRYASMGCFYNAVTQACGFRPVGEDWKMMGLAAFGDSELAYKEMKPLAPRYINGKWEITPLTVQAKLIDRPDILRQTDLWKKLISLVLKHGDRNIAAAAQRTLEENLVEYTLALVDKTRQKNIVFAGGVFHNIKFFMKLREHLKNGEQIYIHPAAGDPGTAIGAALELYHRLTGERQYPRMETMAVGAEYSHAEIEGELIKFRNRLKWKTPRDFHREVAELLAKEKVIGLFHGASEWGPRALGQRSVIACPRNPAMRDRINQLLKKREWFMPFAPAILEEDAALYVKEPIYSPFMTEAFYATEKANQDIPSGVHSDGTVRAQIIRKKAAPHFYDIISAFKDITGIGVVLNTSFNRHGLPTINSPRDAINHLLWGCVDLLAIGPFIVERTGSVEEYRKRIEWSADEIIGKWAPYDETLLAIREKREREAPTPLMNGGK